jgi:ribosomal protein L27
MGTDHTLFAVVEGHVRFRSAGGRNSVSVEPLAAEPVAEAAE